ncbi:MAG: FkbM family methyltransferase [Anaerolineae bacterium]|nr:FkbM family methyltransferase [Anaerolineae bacterium]
MDSKIEYTRLHRYIKTLGPVYGHFLYWLESLGIQKTIPIWYGSDKYWIRLNTTDIHVLYTIFIRQDYKMNILSEPSLIIDAGAYTGFSSIYFSQKYPKAKIIAIEPMPSNFALLKKNILNYPQIKAINKALWFENTRIDMADRETGHWGYAILEEKNLKLKNIISVETITMDNIIQEFDINMIDLLKVDIEGSEKEVFQHHKTWIGSVDTIAIELHDRIKEGCSAAFIIATRSFTFDRKNAMTVFKSRKGIV